ncbi:MAG TPA: ferritin-like domain-containing protein [Kofleriaceae bacterium]|nr:ferritin-like domain-containing protein [Kofleriaceae bacterium]
MKKPTDIGPNRTGIGTSPIDSKRLVEASEELTPFEGVDGEELESERVEWASAAEPVGTMPPPATLKGAAKTAVQLIKGNKPTIFLDKLGERLAFERTGTRLYEALLIKLQAGTPHAGAPTRDDLEQIRDEELRHFAIVRSAIERLGADPTAMTPCADVNGVLAMGLVQVLSDPRTTLTQCLEAMLVAELADNDGWTMLVDLADGLGFDDLTREFRVALQEEETHLARVREWITTAVEGQAGIAPTPPRPEARP